MVSTAKIYSHSMAMTLQAIMVLSNRINKREMYWVTEQVTTIFQTGHLLESWA